MNDRERIIGWIDKNLEKIIRGGHLVYGCSNCLEGFSSYQAFFQHIEECSKDGGI